MVDYFDPEKLVDTAAASLRKILANKLNLKVSLLNYKNNWKACRKQRQKLTAQNSS